MLVTYSLINVVRLFAWQKFQLENFLQIFLDRKKKNIYSTDTKVRIELRGDDNFNYVYLVCFFSFFSKIVSKKDEEEKLTKRIAKRINRTNINSSG